MKIYKYLKLFIIFALFLFLSFIIPAKIFALTSLSSWQQTTPLPYTIASQVSFTNADKIYVIGGSGIEGVANSNVLQASIGNDGSISSWTNISNLPKPIIWHSLATHGSRIYILGGYSGNGIDQDNFNTVYEADLKTNGSISPWRVLTPLPVKSAMGSATIIGDKLYYAGGNLIPQQMGDPSSASSTIYFSIINPEDGSIGDWFIAGELPDKMHDFEMMGIENYLYIFGGINISGTTSSVERTQINPSGSIGAWENQPSFPQEIRRFGLTRVNNNLIVVGGANASSITNEVYYTSIKNDDSISPWQTSPNNLPRINCCSPLVSWGNYIYLTGGHDGNDYFNTVYMANIENITTPSPPPVSKVFLIPGIGASWNINAFATCKPDNNSQDWSLAPYAKDVYNLFISKIPSKGFTVIPFYYDWRQNVKNITPLLTDLLNKNTEQDEKVDIVGHSMGGLIGENYLVSQNGGKASKFLAVGTPNKGSALAYPATANGEVWFNDLTEKIAATLFIKHCGIPDSLKNLLPTYNYLRDSKTNILKPVASMKTQNTFLPINFDGDFWGVKVGTIVGTGFPTLNIIDVTKDPHWPDGKPIGKENTNDGDDTVLAQSAQIPGITADVINQSHTGLIASDMGVSHILTFLGTATTDGPNYTEHKSALVLIGYPGTFSVTDEKNNSITSENGIVAIMDPKDGNYQLQINPSSQNTTFVVGQFLANGQTFYKEYKLKGVNQETKVIEFDSKHPKENILHEVGEYKKPIFPKFWLAFWKFWNKFK